MVFQEVCDDVVRHTDGVLGCFLIDVRRGFAVAAAQRSGVELEDAEIQSVLRSSSDLFRGRLVEQFARSLPNGADAPAEFVQEVQVTKADSYQFMAAMPDWKDGIVILIAENTLSLGFGWMIVRQTQDRLSEALRMVGGDLRRPAHGTTAFAGCATRHGPTASAGRATRRGPVAAGCAKRGSRNASAPTASTRAATGSRAATDARAATNSRAADCHGSANSSGVCRSEGGRPVAGSTAGTGSAHRLGSTREDVSTANGQALATLDFHSARISRWHRRNGVSTIARMTRLRREAPEDPEKNRRRAARGRCGWFSGVR